MGRLLDALLAESAGCCAATPATLATLGPQSTESVAESQESQAPIAEIENRQTARLLAALRAEGLPDEWLGLDHGDLTDLACVDTTGLRTYVLALRTSQHRERGRRPEDETARALCRHCGPVWLAPEVAAVLPTAGGWPRALGCPWCHVANRPAIPRPHVTCGDCRHFIADTVNPAAGMGRCGAAVDPLNPTPMARHECASFEPCGT